jgi:MFS family permease
VFPRGPLRSRSFRWVWSGETISMMGDASYDVVFAWLVLSVTQSPAALGAVMLATTIPRGLLLLVGGAITDRISPRLVMLGSHLARGVAMGALTVLSATDALQVWHLYAIGIVVGVAEAFFWPASGSIMPSLVGAKDLPRANALLGAAEQTCRMVGPMLGGALMAWVSAPPRWASTRSPSSSPPPPCSPCRAARGRPPSHDPPECSARSARGCPTPATTPRCG